MKMKDEELRTALSTPPPEDYLQSLERMKLKSTEDGQYLLMDKPILAPLDMTSDFSSFYVSVSTIKICFKKTHTSRIYHLLSDICIHLDIRILKINKAKTDLLYIYINL